MHFTPLLHIFSESHFYKCVWYLYIRLIPGKRIQRTGIKIKSFFQEPCVFYGSCLSWKSDEGSSTERGHLMRLLSSEMRSSALKLSLEYAFTLNVMFEGTAKADLISLLNVQLSG